TGAGAAGGAYHNPYTGTTTAGEVAHNPYTGTTAERETSYNPYTGTATRTTEAYNPYTGRSASYSRAGRRWPAGQVALSRQLDRSRRWFMGGSSARGRRASPAWRRGRRDRSPAIEDASRRNETTLAHFSFRRKSVRPPHRSKKSSGGA